MVISVKIVKNRGSRVFQKRGMVGAFCKFGVSDTGSPVQNSVIFWFLKQFWGIRGWYNIIRGF